MSVRLRLQRLEDARKAKVAYQETPESRKKTIAWLDNTIRDINERGRLIDEGLIIEGPPEPIKPLRPGASLTEIWLHDLIVEGREKERRELDATR